MKGYHIEAFEKSPKQKAKREEFTDITSGTFIVVDPGTKYMGWAVVRVSEDASEIGLLDRGTIIRKSVGTVSTVTMVEELFANVARYKPEELIIEDYILIPGKTNGVFAVPALIGIVKYEWFKRTGKEAITVKPATWKSVICKSPNAKKLHVREAMKQFLDDETYENIISEFDEVRGQRRGDYGEQDCIDAVALGLYVCLMVIEEQRRQALAL